jgi:hypothetical protein
MKQNAKVQRDACISDQFADVLLKFCDDPQVGAVLNETQRRLRCNVQQAAIALQEKRRLSPLVRNAELAVKLAGDPALVSAEVERDIFGELFTEMNKSLWQIYGDEIRPLVVTRAKVINRDRRTVRFLRFFFGDEYFEKMAHFSPVERNRAQKKAMDRRRNLKAEINRRNAEENQAQKFWKYWRTVCQGQAAIDDAVRRDPGLAGVVTRWPLMLRTRHDESGWHGLPELIPNGDKYLVERMPTKMLPTEPAIEPEDSPEENDAKFTEGQG